VALPGRRAGLDPSVRLTLFDPKLVELAVWQGSAARLVGPNVEEAIEVLDQLIGELDDHYLTLLANRARKVSEGDGLPLHLVGIEELVLRRRWEARCARIHGSRASSSRRSAWPGCPRRYGCTTCGTPARRC
jgi:hypothetical protein